MSFLADILTPLRDSALIAAGRPMAWAFAITGGLASGVSIFANAGGLITEFAAPVALAAVVYLMVLKWFLTRCLGGKGLPRGRFLPWLGAMLVILVVNGISSIAVGIAISNADTIPIWLRYLPTLAAWAFTIALFPFSLLATSFALGQANQWSAWRYLENPDIVRTICSYGILIFALRVTTFIISLNINGNALTNGGLIFGMVMMAITLLLEASFLVSAARRIGSNQQNFSDIFN